MSRIGQQKILLPEGVQSSVEGERILISGPKGKLSLMLPQGIEIQSSGKELTVHPSDGQGASALWGTIRALVANMVQGVHQGFEKKLEIHGVGYRAQLKGSNLELLVGFSHPVVIHAPEGITFTVEKNVITVSGIDKALVGEVAANIRKVRKPEPYKGKGIRYEGEYVRRKAGKKAATGE